MTSNGFKTFPRLNNTSEPANLSGFTPDVQKAVENAVKVEVNIDNSISIPDDPNTCPVVSSTDPIASMFGGMKRVQRGGPRRQARSAPTGRGSDEDSLPSESDSETQRPPQPDALVRATAFTRQQLNEIREKRQKALETIANIPVEATQAEVDEKIEEIMAAGRLFATDEEAEKFALHAKEIREGMIKARGLQAPTELIELRDGDGRSGSAAAERAREISTLKAKSKDERSEEEEERLKTLEEQQARMEALIQEQRDNRYYFMLAVMSHIAGAISIGMSGAPSWFFNSVGDNVRFMFGADNLGNSCDMDNIWNLGYNGDCETATRAAEVMWQTIIGVIGVLAVSFFGVGLSDTSSPFMILSSLSMYSIDSLAGFYRRMGGIRATIGAAASAGLVRAAPIAQTVGAVIKWPLSRLAGVCRRAVGMQPSNTSSGGRRYRRTKKHKRKTRGRKGKKMRKTKNKRKRGSRKKQRGGVCGPVKHTNMTDLYSTGGKKRRKGKARKTRGKTKRKYGKKRGTRKH